MRKFLENLSPRQALSVVVAVGVPGGLAVAGGAITLLINAQPKLPPLNPNLASCIKNQFVANGYSALKVADGKLTISVTGKSPDGREVNIMAYSGYETSMRLDPITTSYELRNNGLRQAGILGEAVDQNCIRPMAGPRMVGLRPAPAGTGS
ncbi:MAG: hypothetical protein WAO98_01120 [Alphaproteobacteria bacterium]